MQRARLWVGVLAAALVAVPASMAHATPALVDGPTRVAVGGGAAAPAGLPGGVHPVPVERLLDTRVGTGAAAGIRPAGSTTSVTVAGFGEVPATGVGAVALTLVATGTTGSGYVTAYPHGGAAPTASALNWTVGRTVSNLALVKVGANGQVDLRVSGSSTNLVADVVGWVETAAGIPGAGTVTALSPARLLDTRNGTGAPAARLRGGTVLPLAVAARGGVPATGAGAVVLNVTAVGGSSSGYVGVSPKDPGPGTASSLNWATGETIANLVVVGVSPAGTVDLRVTTPGSVDLVADVVGWVGAGAPAGSWVLGAVRPGRVLDSRTDAGGLPMTSNQRRTLLLAGTAGLPSAGMGAALLNVTVTGATYSGHLEAFQSLAGLPPSSSLNFEKGRTKASQLVVPVDEYGRADLAVSPGGSAHVVVDVTGYVLAPPADAVPPTGVTGLGVSAVGQQTAMLAWTAPDDPDLRSVSVRRFPAAPAGVANPGTPVPVAAGATSVTDTGLTPGTAYSWTVTTTDRWWNRSSVSVGASTTGLAWTGPDVLTPRRGAPLHVSCASATTCTATDASGQALRFDGTTWSAPVQLFPPWPANALAYSTPLSCPTTTFCLAMAPHAAVVAYRDGAWLAPVTIGPDTPEGSWGGVSCTSATFCALGRGDGYLTTFDGTTAGALVRPRAAVAWWSMSCVSTAFCVAAGVDRSTGAGYVARWNGSTWTVTAVGAQLGAVSCPSTTFCMATDSSGGYVRFNGSTWTSRASIDSYSNFFEGRELSCTSASFCVVLDPQLGVRRWNGSTWSAVTALDPVTDLNGGLDCVSPTMCVVVDQLGRWFRWNGTTWSAAAAFDPTSGGMTSLSCPTDGFCLLTDGTGRALRWTGTWQPPQVVAPHALLADCTSATACLAVDPWSMRWRTWNGTSWTAGGALPGEVRDLDCVDATWCMAVESDGILRRFTGAGWAGAAAVFAGGTGYRVSCVSRTFCLANDGTSWSRWNGTTWSAVRGIPGTSTSSPFVVAVSCASATYCLGGDNHGGTWLFDGTTFRALTVTLPGGQPSDIDCLSSRMCVATNWVGQVSTWNGFTWTAQAPTGFTSDDAVSAVDCSSATQCVLAGSYRVSRSS